MYTFKCASMLRGPKKVWDPLMSSCGPPNVGIGN